MTRTTLTRPRPPSTSAGAASLALALAAAHRYSGGRGPPTAAPPAALSSKLTALDYYTDEPATRTPSTGSRVRREGRRHHRAAERAVAAVQRQGAAGDLDEDAARRADGQQPRPAPVREDRRARPLANLGVDTSLPAVGARSGQVRGRAVRLAPNVNTLVLYYNKTMLDQAGVGCRTRGPSSRPQPKS